MKLTPEQIQTVEKYLNKKKIDYLDIRFEVLDHLASDIETTMETSNVDFETGFEEVKEKWNENLSPTFSFLLGPIYFRPSIFLKRCKKIYKPLFKQGMVFMFLYIFGVAILKDFVFKNSVLVNEILNYFLVSLSFIYVCFICYWFFLIKKTKQKTAFSFLFNTQVAPTILVLILIVSNMVSDSFLEFGSFYTVFIYILFMTLYQGFSFYKNHLKVVSNYKKYQLQ